MEPIIYICEFCLKYIKSRKCLERHKVREEMVPLVCCIDFETFSVDKMQLDPSPW